MPNEELSYRDKIYANLIEADNKEALLSVEDFNKKLDTDNTYAAKLFTKLKEAYGEDNLPKETDFTDRLKKKDSTPPAKESSKTLELGYGTLDEALKGTSTPNSTSSVSTLDAGTGKLVKTVPPTKENPLGVHSDLLKLPTEKADATKVEMPSIPESVYKIPTVTSQQIAKKNLDVTIAKFNQANTETQQLQKELEQSQPEFAKIQNDMQAEFQLTGEAIHKTLAPQLQQKVNNKEISVEDANNQLKKAQDDAGVQIKNKYTPIFAKQNDKYNLYLEKKSDAELQYNRAKTLENTIGIIDRNLQAKEISDQKLQFKDIQSTLMIGIYQMNKMVYGALPIVYRAQNAVNYMGDGVGVDEAFMLAEQDVKASPIMSSLDEFATEQAKLYETKKAQITKTTGTADEAFSKGDYLKWGALEGLNFIEFMPTMLAQTTIGLLTGGTTSVLTPLAETAAFGAQQYYGEVKDREDMSERQKFVNATTGGALFAMAGHIMRGLISPMTSMVVSAGKEDVQKTISSVISTSIKTGLDKSLPLFKPFASALEMYSLGYSQTWANALTDPKYKGFTFEQIHDEATKTGTSMMGMGLVGSLLGTIPEYIKSDLYTGNNKKSANDINSKIDEINAVLPTLDETMQKMMAQQKMDLTSALNAVILKNSKETEHLNDAQKQKLTELNQTGNDIQDLLDNTENPINGEPRKILEDNLKQIKKGKELLISYESGVPKTVKNEPSKEKTENNSEADKGLLDTQGNEVRKGAVEKIDKEQGTVALFESELSLDDAKQLVQDIRDGKVSEDDLGKGRLGKATTNTIAYAKKMLKNGTFADSLDQAIKIKESQKITEKPELEKLQENKKNREQFIQGLKDKRDHKDFKYTDTTSSDAFGNKIKGKRLKTAEELKTSTDKINSAIEKVQKKLDDINKEISATPQEVKTTENGKIREVQKGQGKKGDEGGKQNGEEGGQKNVQKEVSTTNPEFEANNKEAKSLGFDSAPHAIKSVNKYLKTDYKTFEEIPKSDFLKGDLPEGTKKNGYSKDELIDLVAKAAKALAKGAIVTSEHIKQVIDALKETGLFKNHEEKDIEKSVKSAVAKELLGEKEEKKEPIVTKIHQKGIEQDYNQVFSPENEADQKIVDDGIDELKNRAQNNGVSPETEAASHVSDLMQKERTITTQVSQYDVLTTVFHKSVLEKDLAKFNNSGDKDAALITEKKIYEINKFLAENLGRTAGKTLRLFSNMYKEAVDGYLKSERVELADALGIKSLPKSEVELNAMIKDGEIAPTRYEEAEMRDAIQKIEELKKALEVERNKNKETNETVDKEASDKYIKDQKEKKAKAKDDFGSVIVHELKGKKNISDVIKSNDFKNAITKKIRFNSAKLREIIGVVEKSNGGEKLSTESEKDITDIFNKEHEKYQKDLLNKVKKIAKSEKSTSITKRMVDSGTIHDIVNDQIHNGEGDVFPQTLETIKKALPDVTEKQLSEAILRKGEFKKNLKKKVLSDIQQSEISLKKDARSILKLDALESADDINAIRESENLTPKEKAEQIQAKRTEFGKKLEEDIKKKQSDKIEAESLKKKLQKAVDKAKEIRIKAEKEAKEAAESAGGALKLTEAQNRLKEAQKLEDKNKRELQKVVDKIAEKESDIKYLKEKGELFEKYIKKPKETAEELKRLKQEHKDELIKNGIRPQTINRADIQVAKDFESHIKNIQESDLTDEQKSNAIEEIKQKREELLGKTKQGVLINLKENINGLLEHLKDEYAQALKEEDVDRTEKLSDLISEIEKVQKLSEPSSENVDDKINKANQKLLDLSESHPEYPEIKDIQENYENNFKKNAEELQRQRLLDAEQRKLNTAKRQLSAGLYTDIPIAEHDVKRDDEMQRAKMETFKVSKKLSKLKSDAMSKRGDDSWGRIFAIRAKYLIASTSAIGKVFVSGVTKPFMDVAIDQSVGRVISYITGLKQVKVIHLLEPFKSIINTKEGIEKAVNNFNQKYVDKLKSYEDLLDKHDGNKNNKEVKKAHKELLNTELQKNLMFPYLFMNSNSFIDFKQIFINGATDLDQRLSNYKQSTYAERHKSESDFKNNMKELGWWIDSINRTHSIMKNPSARVSGFMEYIRDIQYFQNEKGTITSIDRQYAWDLAFSDKQSPYQQGRFNDETWASKQVAKFKNSKNLGVRILANELFPVAKIGFSIGKIATRMLPFEAIESLYDAGVAGKKLNEAEGKATGIAIVDFAKGINNGIKTLTLRDKIILNKVLNLATVGVGLYVAGNLLAQNGVVKYGGSFNPLDKERKKVKGSDGNTLEYGEWEINGERQGKVMEWFINHNPYMFSFRTAVLHYQEYQQKDGLYKAFAQTTAEVVNTMPVTAALDALTLAFNPNKYGLSSLIASHIPGAGGIAKATDAQEGSRNIGNFGLGKPVKRDDFDNNKGLWENVNLKRMKEEPFERTSLSVKEEGNKTKQILGKQTTQTKEEWAAETAKNKASSVKATETKSKENLSQKQWDDLNKLKKGTYEYSTKLAGYKLQNFNNSQLNKATPVKQYQKSQVNH